MVVNTTPLTAHSVALIRSVSGVESYSDKILYEWFVAPVPTAKKVLSRLSSLRSKSGRSSSLVWPSALCPTIHIGSESFVVASATVEGV